MTNPAYGPCEQKFFTSIEVYSGHYVSANLTQGTPLLLYNPSLIYTCPTAGNYKVTLGPHQSTNETSTVAGFWTGSRQSYTFQAFYSGTYTMAVSDAWGQNVLIYFIVAEGCCAAG